MLIVKLGKYQHKKVRVFMQSYVSNTFHVKITHLVLKHLKKC